VDLVKGSQGFRQLVVYWGSPYQFEIKRISLICFGDSHDTT
jgi:hypothetical protein